MSRIEAEIDALVALGASQGQVEHRMLDLGLRDGDEPTADPGWWDAHARSRGSCCPESGDSE